MSIEVLLQRTVQLSLFGAFDRPPSGVVPLDPPDASAALHCVKTVLVRAVRTLGGPVPQVRWFRPAEGGEYEPDEDGLAVDGYPPPSGIYEDRSGVIWLNVGYEAPYWLANSVAHEAVHHWQDVLRGPSIGAEDYQRREMQAIDLSEELVPPGSIPKPRGKEVDAWYEPARRSAMRRWLRRYPGEESIAELRALRLGL